MLSCKNAIIMGCCVWMELLSSPAQARWRHVHRPRTASYQLQVVVDGMVMPSSYLNGGQVIEGRRGERYVLRIHNRSPRRCEAVICVDGRDVIDGKPCDLNKRGYLVEAWGYVEVDGYRLNMSEVAAFRFSGVTESYAHRMGTPWNIGVINAAFFPERKYHPIPYPAPLIGRKKSRGGHLPLAESETPRWGSRGLGTRFGERRQSPAMETSFIRDNWSRPEARLSVYYDDRDGLCASGLTGFCPYPPPPPHPPYRDFAKPPPGWEHFYYNN